MATIEEIRAEYSRGHKAHISKKYPRKYEEQSLFIDDALRAEFFSVHPDQWGSCERLIESEWIKAEYRLETGQEVISSLAVNIRVTGRKEYFQHYHTGNGYFKPYNMYAIRCKIEFVGDGEPSSYTGAWLYIKYPSL